VTIRNTTKAQSHQIDGPVSLGKKQILGPMGKQMSLEDLPTPKTKRWVIRRKAEVVAGVRGGLLSLDDACRRYSLTIDEFRSWQLLLESHGVKGLRTTKIKKYRHSTTISNEAGRPNHH
jgi:hypothetical protein